MYLTRLLLNTDPIGRKDAKIVDTRSRVTRGGVESNGGCSGTISQPLLLQRGCKMHRLGREEQCRRAESSSFNMHGGS
jgi:hypothetical protein